jgi:hypothetical protein
MLESGSKIWEYEYSNTTFFDSNKIKIRSYTIKENKNGMITVTNTQWEIPFEKIGRDYFLSKQSCIEHAIKSNLEEALRQYDDTEIVTEILKEIKKLCAMLDKMEKESEKKILRKG